MDPELLLELLSDPANAAALSRLGGFDDESQALDRRAGYAQHMLGTPGAQGRQVGHMYVASSPLEHLGSGLMRGIGAARMEGVNKERQAMLKNAQEARQMLAAGLSPMSQVMKARRAQSPMDPNDVGLAAPVGTGEAGTDGWGY